MYITIKNFFTNYSVQMLKQNYFQLHKISYDVEADAIYIRFSDSKYAFSQEIDNNMIIDKDKKGEIIWLEILKASKQKWIVERILFSSPNQKSWSWFLHNILSKGQKKEIILSK